MIFPNSEEDLAKRVKLIIDACTATRQDRATMYRRREAYFLFGTDAQTPVRYNRLEAHLDLVAAFLYAPDHAFFHIAAERNSDDAVVKQAIALQDEFNDDFVDAGLNDLFAEAIPWSLCYDTMIFKQGWNDMRKAMIAELVPPHNFGFYREDIPDLDSQQAFCHTYFLDYSDTVQRLLRAGKGADALRLDVTNKPFVSPFPDLLNRMIISATGGSNLQGNVVGQINPLYTPSASYQPVVDAPTVEWNELWAWDDDDADYRCFHMVQPDILVGDSRKTVEALRAAQKFKPRDGNDDFYRTSSNLFLPRDHPFTKIQPYTKYNYAWGIAHIDRLMALQDWMTERLDQISDILERQADPSKVLSGFSGLSDEKAEAFGGAGTWLYDQLPQAQVKELAPNMPPDLFAEFSQINGLFLEASGLTEVIQGQGAEGVRSRQHASQLQRTGGGRIKRTALKLESALSRIGDIGLKLKMKNDDEPITPEADENGHSEKFIAAQIASDVSIRVDGHSHSPLFGDEAREMALLLRKANAIDNEMLTRMLNPPSRDNIIHSQRRQARAQKQMMQQHPELLANMAKGGKKR
jgi:hypothetical protein